MSLAKAQRLEELAAEAFREVKRRHLTGLPAVISLLVIAHAHRKAAAIRKTGATLTQSSVQPK